MKSLNIGYIIIVMFIVFSGCISQQKDNTIIPTIVVHQSPATTSSLSSGDRYWIRIDPIRDFQTDSTFNITGSTQLALGGTTNFPAGTMLDFTILEENRERILLRTNLEVRNNNSGPNTFSYVYDVNNNPPGRYRVILADSINLNTAISRFNITSDDITLGVSSSDWIHMDPLETMQRGTTIFISGTTNLSAGTRITVSYSFLAHSCPQPKVSDKPGERTFCGGSCHPGEISTSTVRVVEGRGGVNAWNATLNTTDWCWELYGISADAGSGVNAVQDSQSVRFFPG